MQGFVSGFLPTPLAVKIYKEAEPKLGKDWWKK